MRKTQRKTIISIFSLKLIRLRSYYKGPLLPRSQNTSNLGEKKNLGFRLVFQHISRYFDTVVKNPFLILDILLQKRNK